MLLFSDNYDKRKYFQEVLINGQEPEQDENEKPTDYTAEDDDTEDTGNPPASTEPPSNTTDNTNPVDNPDDYTVPNDAEGDNPPSGSAATDNTPNTGEGTDGAQPTDYTADTNDDAQSADDAGGDEGHQDDGNMEGEGDPTDYTSDGGDEGGEDGGGDTGGDEGGGNDESSDAGGDDMGGTDDAGNDDDYGSDDSGSDSNGYDQQIQDLEKDIYADLNEPQMDIRNKELKNNFINLYNMINDIIERINDISKDTASLRPLEFVTSKLNTLSDTVSDYLSYTFVTKSYTENDINYRIFLAAIEDINKVLSTIKPQS